MIYNYLSTPQIIYIVALVVVVVIAILLILLFPIRRYQIKKQFVNYYYKRVYKIAKYNDYYLINNFSFKVDDYSTGKIEHILFADKYVYLINDVFYQGDIAGKIFDKSLIFMSKKGEKHYIDNPVLQNQLLLTRLSMITNLDPSIMIGITLVNDDCQSEIVSESKQFYVISRNKLSYLIKAIESRPIGNLNAKSLEKLVQSINKMNKKGNNK